MFGCLLWLINSKSIEMEKLMTNIIYEDKYIIVCHKNAKTAVETKRIGEADMVSELRNYKNKNNEDTYIGVVHRLDQPVEGVMVFAKNKFAAAELSKQMADNMTDKYYLAVICGKPAQNSAAIVDYLLKESKTNTSKVVSGQTKGAKRSELCYNVIDECGELCLVEIKLLTGRHHQIRVQMSNLGYPLWGDIKYNPDFQEARGVLPALCAYRLKFKHPKTKEYMEFKIEPNNEIFKRFNKNSGLTN